MYWPDNLIFVMSDIPNIRHLNFWMSDIGLNKIINFALNFYESNHR